MHVANYGLSAVSFKKPLPALIRGKKEVEWGKEEESIGGIQEIAGKESKRKLNNIEDSGHSHSNNLYLPFGLTPVNKIKIPPRCSKWIIAQPIDRKVLDRFKTILKKIAFKNWEVISF